MSFLCETVGILSAVWIVSTSSISTTKNPIKIRIYLYTEKGCIHDSSTSAKFKQIKYKPASQKYKKKYRLPNLLAADSVSAQRL